ncbi:MAG: hypothetical protein N2Z81_02050 [Hydrogenothermaceae bacterium]|nr:hypothetical protein [Hydrogenothermaceae bacterium]
MKDIDLNTTVEQVLRKYPFSRRFFESKSMYCNVCACKTHERLEIAAINYGHDPKQFVEELKDFIKNYGKSEQD